ncbi:tetratricopeptide repeat protein [Desulfobacterales bacterium HSG16]|nr:tetratricopeptide repeat protein [Desulfobacterales bacterium HSG16]
MKKSGFDDVELKGLHEVMGKYHWSQGKYVSRLLIDDVEAIHHFRKSENHVDADELARGVAIFYYSKSNFFAANRLVEEIVKRDDPPSPWWALNKYGLCQQMLGFLENTLDSYKRALPVAVSKEKKGTTLNNIGQIYHDRGNYEKALKYLEDSLLIRREIGDKSGMIPTLHNMASIAKNSDDLEKAINFWSEAFTIAMETKNAMGLFHVGKTLGSVLAEIGNKEEAIKLLTMAVNVGKQAGFPNVDKVEEELKSITS